MTTTFPFPTPLVLGHRGASAHAPENTLAAFRLALEQGADGIELDARLTRDGEVVVLHDGRVERVSNGQGRLADLTLAEVQRLDAGSRFSPAFAGERIPGLGEVFETLGDRPVYDLEIKNFGAPGNGLERKVLALVRRYGLEKRVMITSFNPNSVRFFRRELPEAPAGLLLLGGSAGRLEEALFTAWTSGNLLGLFHAGLTPALIDKPRSVLVWGVQTPADVRRAVDLGASGVIADDPAMARYSLSQKAREEKNPHPTLLSQGARGEVLHLTQKDFLLDPSPAPVLDMDYFWNARLNPAAWWGSSGRPGCPDAGFKPARSGIV